MEDGSYNTHSLLIPSDHPSGDYSLTRFFIEDVNYNEYWRDTSEPFWNDINTTITVTNPNDVVIDTTRVIPFNSTENATIISLSADDIPDVSEGTYHLYHDGWNKGLHNVELGPPTEASILYLQAVELDMSNEGSDTTDYKATDAMPIQLTSDQIAALKAANGSEADNNLIMINMHMNLSSVPDVMREPEVEIIVDPVIGPNIIPFSSSENATTSITLSSNLEDLSIFTDSNIKNKKGTVISPPPIPNKPAKKPTGIAVIIINNIK